MLVHNENLQQTKTQFEYQGEKHIISFLFYFRVERQDDDRRRADKGGGSF